MPSRSPPQQPFMLSGTEFSVYSVWPSFWTSTLYLPGGTVMATYLPSLPVFIEIFWPFSVLLKIRRAPGIGCPLWSFTMPCTRVIWACAVGASSTHAKASKIGAEYFFIEVSPKMPIWNRALGSVVALRLRNECSQPSCMEQDRARPQPQRHAGAGHNFRRCHRHGPAE